MQFNGPKTPHAVVSAGPFVKKLSQLSVPPIADTRTGQSISIADTRTGQDGIIQGPVRMLLNSYLTSLSCSSNKNMISMDSDTDKFFFTSLTIALTCRVFR